MAERKRLAVLVTVLAVYMAMAMPGAVSAGQFDDAFMASANGDYAKAVRLYRPLAERGHATAQLNLGIMYADGRGVAQDHAAAAKWYRKAAEQGHAGAQYNLAFMYRDGRGVAQDYGEALRWFHSAAEQGEIHAQNNLGIMYSRGYGATRDYVQTYICLLGMIRTSRPVGSFSICAPNR
jgi:uncharacterized protein